MPHPQVGNTRRFSCETGSALVNVCALRESPRAIEVCGILIAARKHLQSCRTVHRLTHLNFEPIRRGPRLGEVKKDQADRSGQTKFIQVDTFTFSKWLCNTSKLLPNNYLGVHQNSQISQRSWKKGSRPKTHWLDVSLLKCTPLWPGLSLPTFGSWSMLELMLRSTGTNFNKKPSLRPLNTMEVDFSTPGPSFLASCVEKR